MGGKRIIRKDDINYDNNEDDIDEQKRKKQRSNEHQERKDDESEEYYFKLIEDKGALQNFLEKTIPSNEKWTKIQETIDSDVVKQLAHLILEELIDFVRTKHTSAINLLSSWLQIPFFTKYYILNCLPFKYTEKSSAYLETETLFGVLLSQPYTSKVRSCFAAFLNSPKPKVRSSVLSFIAVCINNSRPRTTILYEDYIIKDKIPFGTRVNNEISPVLIINLTIMLSEMIHSLIQNDRNGHQNFNLYSSILMPNMLASGSEVRWHATTAEYNAMKTKEVEDFKSSSKEYRDAATRGLLLLYTISVFHYGYIPELKTLKSIENLESDQWSVQDLEIRKQYLLDPQYQTSMIKVWHFISTLLAHDIMHQPSQTKPYFDYFITAMKDFFTLVQNPISDEQKQSTITLFTKVFLNANQCILSWYTRTPLITWLHACLTSKASYRQVADSLIQSGELNEYIVQFATETAKYSFDRTNTSLASMHLRSTIVYVNKMNKKINDLPASVISKWCDEITSYLGAAFDGLRTIVRAEKNLEQITETRLAAIKKRTHFFIIDINNFLKIIRLQENVNLRCIARLIHLILDAVAGPNCEDLAITRMQELSFSPKFLLSIASIIALNFSTDIRVYSIFAENERKNFNLLKAVIHILQEHCIAPLDVVEAMQTLQVKVDRLKELLKENEIPAGFEDPLHFSIMTEPVLLPSSQAIVDRETIVRFFQEGNNIDPYTRVPLTIDEVIPQNNLKSQIDQFWSNLEEKINKD